MTSANTFPGSLVLFTVFYGGMVTLGGVLGAKQASIGPLVVETGIFPFLMLVALGSAVADIHGKDAANRMARYGFVPLIMAIVLTWFVLALPTDPGMYGPAKAAFPIVLGQSSRMMAAGIISYGISSTLNIWIFDRLRQANAGFAGLRGFVAAASSQIIDTLLFITISFYGVRPLGQILLSQMLAKVVLSAVLVPLIIWLARMVAQRLDGAGNSA